MSPSKKEVSNLTDDITELMIKYKLRKINIYNASTTGYITIMDKDTAEQELEFLAKNNELHSNSKQDSSPD